MYTEYHSWHISLRYTGKIFFVRRDCIDHNSVRDIHYAGRLGLGTTEALARGYLIIFSRAPLRPKAAERSTTLIEIRMYISMRVHFDGHDVMWPYDVPCTKLHVKNVPSVSILARLYTGEKCPTTLEINS